MDNQKRSKLSSIFGGLIKKKADSKETKETKETKEDNVECSMISHMDEFVAITGFQDSVLKIEEQKTDQVQILEINKLLTDLVIEYPILEIPETPLKPEIKNIKPQEQAKISLSTRGKSSLPVSYSFYKCPMTMEYCIGSSYNFDNDIVINPGRYEIGASYDGENINLQMKFSEYALGDNGSFYKTENLTGFITIEITKKTKIGFFALPKVAGKPYDVKSLDINFNLLF